MYRKIIKNGFVILAASVSLSLASCKRYSGDFGDTNQNPAVTSTPIYGALLTFAESALGGYASQVRYGLYAQYFSETQYTDISLYSLPQLAHEGEYLGILNDLQNIINNGPNDNIKAVSRILKTYYYSTITDRWGDVPYSQALSGVSKPAFDKQSEIYTGMLSELTAAVNQFGGTGVIAGDIVYGGNVAKWKKLANSLRMRLAIQISKRFPAAGAYAAVQFNAALNDPAGFISDNADNFILAYPGGNFKSPWFNLYDGRRDIGESEPMVNLLSSLGDGRQSVFGSSAQGVPYGRLRAYVDTWTGANPNWSRVLEPSYRNENGKVVVLSAAETFLHRAEAADRGWTSENMNTVYQQGIQASFSQWGLTAPAPGYFSQSGVVLNQPAGTAANLKNIAIQQYIGAYPDGLRGWNIWRRTGWPLLTPAPDATNTSRQIPRRCTYGQTSYSSNAAAVNAAVASLSGGDTQDAKIWWDQ
ncbi:MAG: SusD/RagB family nutrient-binding outer membrane lipoprotein [Chitinophagaceae bacterium]|nr:SusD/RagB family nutrient-binding outer membrane lipoprotein [Chitinophagaceae bacterium]